MTKAENQNTYTSINPVYSAKITTAAKRIYKLDDAPAGGVLGGLSSGATYRSGERGNGARGFVMSPIPYR